MLTKFVCHIIMLIHLTGVCSANKAKNGSIFTAKIAGIHLAQTSFHSQECTELRNDSMLIKHLQTMVDVEENPRVKNAEDFVIPYQEQDAMLFRRALQNNLNISRPPLERAIYVRNQKVASQTLYYQSERYAGATGHEVTIPYDWSTNEVFDQLPCQASDMYFTFIRDPIQTFISGWLEFLIHTKKIKNKKISKHDNLGTSVTMNRRNATNMFRAFLDDIENQRHLGISSFHTWPQAMKVGGLPKGCKLDFIGQLSTFDDSLKAIFPSGSLPENKHEASDSSYKDSILKTFHYGDDEIKRMCKYLKVDYVCFGFPLPAVCENA